MFFRRVSSRISICLSLKKKKNINRLELPVRSQPNARLGEPFSGFLILRFCFSLFAICIPSVSKLLSVPWGGEFSQEERLFAKSKVEKPGHGAMTKYKKRKKKETFQEELCYDPVVPTLTSLPPSGVNTSRKGSEMKVEIHTVNLRLQIKQPGEKKIPSFVDLLSVH